MSFSHDLPLGWALDRDERGIKLSSAGRLPVSARPPIAVTLAEVTQTVRQPASDPDGVQLADAQLTFLLTTHADLVPPLAEPVAAEPPVDEEAIRRKMLDEELAGVSRFKRSARHEAEVRAHSRAKEAVAAAKERRSAALKSSQERLDADWRTLRSNDAETVLGQVEATLAARQLPAAPCGLAGDSLSGALLIPDASELISPYSVLGGAVYPRSQPDQDVLFLATVSSLSLAVAREALAVAPAVSTAVLVVLTEHRTTATMSLRAAFRFARADLEAVDWGSGQAMQAAARAAHPGMTGGLAVGHVPPAALGDADAVRRVVQAVGGHLDEGAG